MLINKAPLEGEINNGTKNVGILEVVHDETLNGKGTNESPLKVSSTGSTYSKKEIDDKDINVLISANGYTDEKIEEIVTAEADPIWNAEKGDYAKMAEVPKKTSELTNDSEFVTSGELDFGLNETLSEAEDYTDSKIAEVKTTHFEVVETLPEEGLENIIYLVAKTEQAEKDIYDEYIWLVGAERYEFIGTTQIDLSNYYNKLEIDNYLNDKQEISPEDDVLYGLFNGALKEITPSEVPFLEGTTINPIILEEQITKEGLYHINGVVKCGSRTQNFMDGLYTFWVNSSGASYFLGYVNPYFLCYYYMPNFDLWYAQSYDFANDFVRAKNVTQTVEGIKTFSGSLRATNAPTNENDVVRKKDLDTTVGNINSLLDSINGEVIE